MRSINFLTGMAVLLFVGTGHAAGLSIDPGQWEMTSTMTMSMMPQPMTTTDMECIEESELNPEDFNDDEAICQTNEYVVNGNTARWSVSCTMEGGQTMKGQWEVTSGGDTLSGQGSMTMDYSGQEMKMDMNWKGKRIGDC